jgi:flagellin-like protein
MKGVSEIIAIILILMIVIALAALAYTWFSGIFSSLTSTAGTSVTQSTNAMASNFNIESARNFSLVGGVASVSVSLRNVGTQAFDMTQIGAYVNNLPYSTTGNSGSLVPGAVQNFNVTSVPNPCGQVLKITIGSGLSQTATITGC